MKKSLRSISHILFLTCLVQMGSGQDVTLTTQAEVNAFNSTSVDGTLTIEGDDIVDLSPLNSLESVKKGLIIQNCPYLLEVNGFENLDSVGVNGVNVSSLIGPPLIEHLQTLWGVAIQNNENLNSLSIFPSLDFTGGIYITDNPKLQELTFEADTTGIWGYTCCSISTPSDYGDELVISNNRELKHIIGNYIDTDAFTCENNPALTIIKGLEFDARMDRLVLKDLPELSDFDATFNSGIFHDFLIENTGIESINQFPNVYSLGSRLTNVGITIRQNRFLKDISLPNLKRAAFDIDSNLILETISLPLLRCMNSLSFLPSGNGSISENNNLDSVFVGTECLPIEDCGVASGSINIYSNANLRYIEYFPFLMTRDLNTPWYDIYDNPNLISLNVGLNAQGTLNNNSILDANNIYGSLNDYNITWGAAPDNFSIECTDENLRENIDDWIESHRLVLECHSLAPDNIWSFFNDYTGPGIYNIEIFVPFISGDTIRKDLTLEVLTINTPEILSGPQVFDYLCDDNNFDVALQDWLDNLGYAELSPVCREVIWTDDFIELNDSDITLVTFTATDTLGNVLTSFDASINNLISDGTIQILAQPTDLEVICSNDLQYQTQINNWIDINGSGEVLDPCQPVTWSNDYNFDYSVGSYLVTFEAFSTSGVLLDEEVTLTILPSVEPPLITNGPEDLILIENDPVLEQKIQIWLNDQGGAEAIYNCGALDWSHNYDFDYAAGNRFVTFTATSDNMMSADTVGLIAIQACLGQWTNQVAEELTVQCDQAGGYIDQVDSWLSNNANLSLTSDCDDVIWTNDWEGNYDFGNYWVTFTASGATSAFEYSRGAFLSIQRGDAAPMITTEPSDLALLSNDQALESSIASWLLSNGGAEAVDNCGTFTWSNDYVENYNPGDYLVTFTATSDNGSTAQTTATLTIELASSVEEEKEDSKIILAPNPVENVISVSSTIGFEQIEIYHINGKEVYNSNHVNARHLNIDVSHLPTGVYFVTVLHISGQRQVHRIVKE